MEGLELARSFRRNRWRALVKHHLPLTLPLLPDGAAKSMNGWRAVGLNTVRDQNHMRRKQLDLQVRSTEYWCCRLGPQAADDLFLGERLPRTSELDESFGQELSHAL